MTKTVDLEVGGVGVSIRGNTTKIYDIKEEVSPKKGERICQYLCEEGFLSKKRKITYHILRPE